MHILLVDDKKKVLDFIRPLLEQQGNTIDTALNGLDAFEKAQQQSFDLFIIDHLMPVMNGIQLSRNLLKKPNTANIPIIFMTTQNTTDVIALTRFFSFQAIIAKPIDENILLSAVNLINKNNTSRYSL
ncbi:MULTISPECIES: response regulator [unclassified Colwellia]|uniref:response regulator n=1 Tax=unclassified Colwellia TaxID=196834 RepID=UPI0015F52E80|nr:MULTISPECIES: response regulator [unclassified Colwellia]MBA6231549.1 response regulator [Colwellia sp. MB02u-7]MBA6235413.1 response regulator [Colwellia sp. MB02u-11]MBA6254630.1 response regulator [Colwellia sp. MB3u-28]MBA6259926.1 response regulator [Colwellia sp. MB3u-41]MBA6299887.1 response regulator [Colwellia sp. MB3u-22]